ncbi:MAG: peptidase M75 superfamily protein, partial [Bacteroidota bacterium]|nr:peptidase M75 superfamily protein [Bacteroidota bacterium]
MKISFVSISFAFGIALLFTATSCEKDNKINKDKVPFDRKVMLENIGNNIIIPNYNNLVLKLQDLKSTTDNFTSSPNIARLEESQAAYLNSYKAWQHCSAFEFGPAEQKLLRANVNTFPTDT